MGFIGTVRKHVVQGPGAGPDRAGKHRGLHVQSDGLPGQSLHKDLHPTAEPENQVERGLLLDVVVRKGPPIFQLPREVTFGANRPLLKVSLTLM